MSDKKYNTLKSELENIARETGQMPEEKKVVRYASFDPRPISEIEKELEIAKKQENPDRVLELSAEFFYNKGDIPSATSKLECLFYHKLSEHLQGRGDPLALTDLALKKQKFDTAVGYSLCGGDFELAFNIAEQKAQYKLEDVSKLIVDKYKSYSYNNSHIYARGALVIGLESKAKRKLKNEVANFLVGEPLKSCLGFVKGLETIGLNDYAIEIAEQVLEYENKKLIKR